MAISPLLATVKDLGTLLKQPNLAESDEYAIMMLGQASQAVRDAAHQPGWVRKENADDVLPTGMVVAPASAAHIALWVASRAFTDPRNRSRRTSGPISESFFENGVYGLDMTDGERLRLEDMRPTDGSSFGLYVAKLAGDPVTSPVILADIRAGSDPLLYAGPEWAWAFTPRVGP